MKKNLTIFALFSLHLFCSQSFDDKDSQQLMYYGLDRIYFPEYVTDLEKIKNFTQKTIQVELVKNEFEKQIEYDSRIRNFDVRLQEILNQNFAKVLQRKNTIYSASVVNYDSESETFTLKVFNSKKEEIKLGNEELKISVPISIAPYFKQRFSSEIVQDVNPIIIEIKEFTFSDDIFIPKKILVIFPNVGSVSDLNDDVFHHFSFNLLYSEKDGTNYILSNKSYRNETKYHSATLHPLPPIQSMEQLRRKWHFIEWNINTVPDDTKIEQLKSVLTGTPTSGIN